MGIHGKSSHKLFNALEQWGAHRATGKVGVAGAAVAGQRDRVASIDVRKALARVCAPSAHVLPELAATESKVAGCAPLDDEHKAHTGQCKALQGP